MFKRIVSLSLLCALLTQGVQAQRSAGGSSYKNAVGLRVEFGTGNTWVGPSIKHFFNEHSAGEFQLLFGNHSTILDLEYQYHGTIAGAAGLRWFFGLGPALALYKNGSDLYLRPIVGLDYKIPGAPLNLGFDWRPTFRATHGEFGDRFTAARFSIPMRITF
ncbi:MAG: hypothetical protein EOO12_02580 [Chitinophagaceae bacterium]|nr:MAG: hypothetical protein EOO12_02580 [Chitinophagaceae bacterium]